MISNKTIIDIGFYTLLIIIAIGYMIYVAHNFNNADEIECNLINCKFKYYSGKDGCFDYTLAYKQLHNETTHKHPDYDLFKSNISIK